ncbi:DUF4390 domain-containing protein [Paralcaligenes ureilyticus]|uniref:Uncharacterized protein DUF4390 n=1 Tax=Paralcaligenes ureilyticus TaxID=627131 RepID=A0A4R3MCT7_9BURK|nr:DUF4390 domain-containing protein [Paralcaligenes ureilyticus]TCT11246.1 uncharacterized protein DUF4390 [Paralcaligenes ureilyticus]
MIVRVLLFLVLSVGLASQVDCAWAAEPAQVVKIDPVARDGKLYIDADIQFDVSRELRNAAQKGVPIYFTADLKITSRRWWWFDRTLVDKQRTWRIVYNALTRQWRVGTGDLSLPESSLDDSLSLIRHIRGWDVIDTRSMDPEHVYHGQIRLRLDTSRLARPFQIDAISSNAWSLATPWKDFTFSVSAGKPDPS